jgi:hypothetical protein
MTDPGIENAARWGPGAALKRTDRNRINTNIIHKCPTRRHLAVDFVRAIRNALDRESRQARPNTPPDALEGISRAWEGRVP